MPLLPFVSVQGIGPLRWQPGQAHASPPEVQLEGLAAMDTLLLAGVLRRLAAVVAQLPSGLAEQLGLAGRAAALADPLAAYPAEARNPKFVEPHTLLGHGLLPWRSCPKALPSIWALQAAPRP